MSITFCFKIKDGNLIVIPAGIVAKSASVLSNTKEKMSLTNTDNSLDNNKLTVPIERIDNFLSLVNVDIKNFYLHDQSIFYSTEEHNSCFVAPFLDLSQYNKLKVVLNEASKEVADKVIIPKKVELYELVKEMVFKKWQVLGKKSPERTKYTRNFTEIQFLIDCLLNLKEDEQGGIFCNLNDCLGYLKNYQRGKKYHSSFESEMIFLFKAIDPELTLQGTDFHNKFSFTKEGSEKLKKLLKENNCIDIIDSESNSKPLVTENDNKRLKNSEIRMLDLINKNTKPILERSSKLMTLLETTSRKNTAYREAAKTANLLHKKLQEEFKRLEEDMLKDTLTSEGQVLRIDEFVKECVSYCEDARGEFSRHRGLWYRTPLLRAILGLIATITILPALLVEAFSPHGYRKTFFSLPATNSVTSLDEIKKDIQIVFA